MVFSPWRSCSSTSTKIVNIVATLMHNPFICAFSRIWLLLQFQKRLYLYSLSNHTRSLEINELHLDMSLRKLELRQYCVILANDGLMPSPSSRVSSFTGLLINSSLFQIDCSSLFLISSNPITLKLSSTIRSRINFIHQLFHHF